MQRKHTILSVALIFLLAWTAGAGACSIPVFRYALERWPADSYQAVVFHKGPLDPKHQAIVKALKAIETMPEAMANFTVLTVDVAGKMDQSAESLWKAQKNATAPWLVLRYPNSEEDGTPAWAGPLDAPQVKRLVDSPARRHVVSRILNGESIVWLLIESGDKAKDDAAEKLLTEQFAKLLKTLELPKVDPNDPDVEGPTLRSPLKLRLAFSHLRVSRTDPAEKLFVSMIANSDKNVPADQPLLVPVFGRGRALGVIWGKELSADSIAAAAKFLTDACSCQVKDLNPGTDLLLCADWDGLMEPSIKLKEPKIPEIP